MVKTTLLKPKSTEFMAIHTTFKQTLSGGHVMARKIYSNFLRPSLEEVISCLWQWASDFQIKRVRKTSPILFDSGIKLKTSNQDEQLKNVIVNIPTPLLGYVPQRSTFTLVCNRSDTILCSRLALAN